MKKRILSLVLALSMMISLFPVSALAQTPSGGSAVLAEENGEMKGTTGSITINNSGVPVTDGLDIDSDGNYIGTNWKYNADGEGTLTLMSGTWNLANQNAVKCYVAIDEKATVAGGTFENTVWNEVGGKISGGTFKKTVSNKGTITGGIFVGVDSGSTSVINSGDGKITGGVFKVLPSNGIDSAANQYRIEFADTANTDTLSVNDVDFGTGKVYVVGMDNETLNVRTTNTAISTINNTISVTHGHNYTNFVPSNVRLDEEKDGSTYLLKLNKTITKLEIGSNGCPITTGRETMYSGIYIAGHKGYGWTYGDSMLTLYQTNDGWDFPNNVELQCDVKVSNGATLKGGVFNKWVANWGTIENGVYRADVTNYDGTIENGIFLKKVDSIGTGYDSIVQGGVFKSEPSWVANGYREHTITSYVSNRTIKVKIDGVLDFEDVGSSPVVVTKEGEGTTISVQLWESGANGQATTIRSLNGKAIGTDNCNSSWDESTKTLTFTTPAEGDVVLNGPLKNAELEFESGYRTNGQYPVGTDGGKKNASGNGWEYVAGTGGEYGTLTLTNGTYDLSKKQPTNPESEALGNPIGAKLVIARGAVVTDSCVVDAITIENGGKIASSANESIPVRNDIIIKNGGIIENAKFVDEKIQNSGTIINGIYSGSTDVTNNVGGVIEDGTFYSYVDVINNAGGRIEGGTYYCAVVNNANAVIADGLFVKGLSTSEGASEGSIAGGIFNLSDEIAEKFSSVLHKVTAPNCKVRMDGNGTNWNLYAAKDKMLKLQLMGNDHLYATVYNLNGKTDAYDATGLGTTTVSFTMPNEGVVLNKTATLTVQNDIEDTVSDVSNENVIINELVNLTAAKQTGCYFTGWTVSDGVTLTNSGGNVNLGSERIAFDMPAENVTLTATYAKTPKYTLTVDGGYIGTDENQTSGNYEAGATIKLTAKDAAEGKEFDKWELDGLTLKNGYQETNATIEVTINGNATAKATYKDKAPTTYTLTVEDGYIGTDKNQISGNYEAGATIKLTAEDAAEGEQFEKWELTGLTLKNGYQETNATIEVTITGNATAKATYKDKAPTTYTLTVDGGYIGDDETKASGDYEANAGIKVTAKAKTGYHFTKWTVKEDTLSLSEEELKANPLTFEMPDGAVSLKANYEKDTPDPVDPNPTPNPTPNPDAQPTTYTITTDIYGEVNGGASATVKENDWVHMTVAEVPEGMTFDYWNIPDALLKALQKQNSGFRNNVESLSFQMPDMGEEEQTFAIKANFRSSELPGEDDGPSALGTMATVTVGGAAAGILVWQGVSLGVDSYLQLNLPKGVAVPANRRELVVLLWETAGKPEAALPSLYSDVPAEEIELQKATRWAIDNGLVKPADDSDASRFDPDRYVTKYDVFGAWLKLKKLMK